MSRQPHLRTLYGTLGFAPLHTLTPRLPSERTPQCHSLAITVHVTLKGDSCVSLWGDFFLKYRKSWRGEKRRSEETGEVSSESFLRSNSLRRKQNDAPFFGLGHWNVISPVESKYLSPPPFSV